MIGVDIEDPVEKMMARPGRKPTIRTPEEVIAYVAERRRKKLEAYHRDKNGKTPAQQAVNEQLKRMRACRNDGTLYSILYEIEGVVAPDMLDRIPKDERDDNRKRGDNIKHRYIFAKKRMTEKLEKDLTEGRINVNERAKLTEEWFQVSKSACIKLLNTTSRKFKAEQAEWERRRVADAKLCEKYDKEDEAKAEKKQKNIERGRKKATKTLKKINDKKKSARVAEAVRRCVESRKNKNHGDNMGNYGYDVSADKQVSFDVVREVGTAVYDHINGVAPFDFVVRLESREPKETDGEPEILYVYRLHRFLFGAYQPIEELVEKVLATIDRYTPKD